MTRRSNYFAPLAALAITGVMLGSPHATAQNESILAEVYGHGVHAFYAGQYDEANKYLSSAIDGGTRDPRAYYFRGIVASYQGLTEAAEADWMEGAKMEARSGGGASVGQSLSRFQGVARLQLEQIRQKARLEAMIKANQRSDARMNQLGVQPGAAVAPPAVTGPPPTVKPTPPAVKPAPPAPTAPVASDPFADDGPALAGGQPKLESPDALEGLDGNPFKDDAPAATGEAADAGMGGGDNSNPFGDVAPPTGGEAGDPFGAPAGGNDPFGGDPFGN